MLAVATLLAKNFQVTKVVAVASRERELFGDLVVKGRRGLACVHVIQSIPVVSFGGKKRQNLGRYLKSEI